MQKKNRFIYLLLILFLLPFLPLAQHKTDKMVKISTDGPHVTLTNDKISLNFDLERGTYSIKDLTNRLVVIDQAYLSADGWNAPHNDRSMKIKKVTWHQKDLEQNEKKGKRLELFITGKSKILPEYRFAFNLYEGDNWLSIQPGIKNTTPNDCRLMKAELFCNAKLFPGAGIKEVKTLNGAAGSNKAEVWKDVTRQSTNSMMLTALVNGKRSTLVWGGLHYAYFYASTQYKKEDTTIHLYMNDPTGRLVKKNEEWWVPDTYYLGLGEPDPFNALEQYGLALRSANNAKPNVYDFPTLCGWAVGSLSKGKNINNSAALVAEMDKANKCGLTKYTKVSVRLEPDSYCYTDGNTEQGWWDDEHWSKFGHLVKPYETFAKWCAAVKSRNGLPLTYFQSGMPSDDFARAHPDWMLYKDISKLHLYHRHHQPYVRYDYTNKNFQQYVLNMWERLRKDGIEGIKFDYPETAWNTGGFDDSLATTTSAYRSMFKLCRDGLGPDAKIHERALGESERPTLDVTAGIVDIQRTAGDNNVFNAPYVSTGGLRWYKAGAVFTYYPDSKALHLYNDEVRQSLLTMMALTSGRLELATPFDALSPKMVHEISRIYPYYHGLKSARPVDAFTGSKNPQVYDLVLTPDWHQVALFNSGNEKAMVSVALDKALVDGGLALPPSAEFYVYDFWKDRFIGRVKGNSTLSADLNSLACAMYSVRKVQSQPQLLSTNRHILQGWMETANVQWKSKAKTLSGSASVVIGEPFRMVIAENGYKTSKVKSDQGQARIENHPTEKSLKILVIESPLTQRVNWSIAFKK